MSGIHHVTAISGKAAHNWDFYTRIIGLRFVKKTVNFDDPGTYHLYYGDKVGHPGTILTFFPWEHAAPGRGGVGLAQQTTFRVPASAIGYWTHRFVENGVAHEAPEKRFGDTVLSFTDPDGMSLALVGAAGAEAEPAWSAGNIPAEHAVRGFHGVTLMVEDAVRTAAVRCITSHFAPRTTPARRRWRKSSSPISACGRPISSTGSISARFISANPAMSCSRSRPTFRASRRTNRSPRSAAT